MSLAVWWWTSEAVPHPFQLQGGVVSISKCQKLSPGGISELRWWALAVSLGTNAHLTKPTAISWHEVSHCRGMWCQAAVPCFMLSLTFPHKWSPVGFLYSKVHKYTGWAQRVDPLLPSSVWYFQAREELCWHAEAGSGVAGESQGKSVLSNRAVDCL